VRSEISFSAHCRRLAAAAFAATLLLALPTAATAQQVVAFVNGQPITNLDIEHRAKFLQMTTKKVPSRKEVMDSIIDEILEIVEAKRYGLEVPDEQITSSYKLVAERMGIDADKLTQLLTAGGASADTLKRRLRAQVAWANLVRGRFKASLEIRDKDVEAQMQLHKPDEKNDVGYEYIMRPVILIVPHGSADAAFEARKREAEALRSRFQNCDEGVTFARALADVAVRDQISKFSSDLAPQLRQILDGTTVGRLTPPEQTAEGIQLFAICGKKETKSETPEMKEIRDQMFQQKFGAQAKRYLETLRRQAMIEYKVPEAKLRDQKDQKDQK
jgi:peptidyl-prolyl cis-trans isomerase SurA